MPSRAEPAPRPDGRPAAFLASPVRRRGRAAGPWIAAALTLLLASCGGPPHPRSSGNAPHRPRGPVSDTPVKIGQPYQVQGRWYYPNDARDYDEVGMASWYGPGFHRGTTANGEYYDSSWISAAHKTLPLPCYVEVTALDTGRTILVRINDRGPFVADRIIDLSQGAARLLGIEKRGLSRVRVRRVEPGADDRLALRTGKPAVMRPTASPTELAALNARYYARAPIVSASAAVAPPLAAAPVARPPVSAMAPPASAPLLSMPGGLFVQVATLSDQGRASALASALSAYGSSRIEPAGPYWRVRMGPFVDDASAEAALARIQGQGYQDARIVRN